MPFVNESIKVRAEREGGREKESVYVCVSVCVCVCVYECDKDPARNEHILFLIILYELVAILHFYRKLCLRETPLL